MLDELKKPDEVRVSCCWQPAAMTSVNLIAGVTNDLTTAKGQEAGELVSLVAQEWVAGGGRPGLRPRQGNPSLEARCQRRCNPVHSWLEERPVSGRGDLWPLCTEVRRYLRWVRWSGSRRSPIVFQLTRPGT